MKNKIKLVCMSIFCIIFIIGLMNCGGASGGDGKYPKLNKFMTSLIKVVKDNKDKPDEIQKQVKVLLEKDKDAIKVEGEKFQKAIDEKMKDMDKSADMSTALPKMLEAFKAELPIMEEFFKMMMDPTYASLLQMPELKDSLNFGPSGK